MSARGEEVVIVCGSVALSDRAAWTKCKCGRDIVHGIDLEERARALYPGRPLLFECMACRSGDLADRDKIRNLLRETRRTLPEDLRELVDRADPEWLVAEIQKMVPQ